MKNKIIKKIAEAPAEFLAQTISGSRAAEKTLAGSAPVKKIEEFWHVLGPGLTTGAADDDPSGIATYSQAGARFGNQLLWLAPLTFPLMAIVQEMCARIGMVTGRGLAANIRSHYSRRVLYLCTLLLSIANTFNIGADLGAMAKATQLVIPDLPFSWLVAIFAVASLILQIFVSYKNYAKYLKWLSLILFSYVLSAIAAGLNWPQILREVFWPTLTFSKEQIVLICGVFGTTISPYLFFWQTSQEVEEEILEGRNSVKLRKLATDSEIKKMRIDVWSGMFLSNLVMFFIIATCGGVLFAHGITNIQTADQAALALRPFAGEFTYILFALGVVGVGLLALPVLAGAVSYAIAESFNWPAGLYRKLQRAKAFYGIIIISTLVGLLVNFFGIDPISALIYSAVLNGIIAPVILVLINLIAGSKKIMGVRASGAYTKFIGWFAAGLMGAIAIVTLFVLF